MKVSRTKYVILTLERGKGRWTFTMPAGLIVANNERERLRLVVRKAVMRNDFLVIKPGTDTLYIDGAPLVLRSGSPNALQLAAELNTMSPYIRFSFDSYDGKLKATNIHSVSHTLNPGTLSNVIGLSQPITLTPGQTYRMPFGVDLAPPEVLFLRVDALQSSAIEVDNSDSRSRDLLCVIGVESAPYATLIYRDTASEYGQLLSVQQLDTLTLRLVDVQAIEQVSNNPITLVIAIEFVIDDERQILSVLEKTYDVQSLALLRENIKQ